MTDWQIRTECPDDAPSIYAVVEAAFAGQPYADGDEQDLVNALRDAGALAVSLVAEAAGEVVGYIGFSPAVPDDGSAHWYALAPVAVRPDWQSRGLGAALVTTGLAELRQRKAAGCVLIGNPAYYQRFGFELSPAHCPASQPEAYYQCLSLSTDAAPQGAIDFHSTFYLESRAL